MKKFIKLIALEFTNFTPTYLEIAHIFSGIIVYWPLVTIVHPMSENDFKTASTKEYIMNSELPNLSTRMVSASYCTVEEAVEAVQYIRVLMEMEVHSLLNSSPSLSSMQLQRGF